MKTPNIVLELKFAIATLSLSVVMLAGVQAQPAHNGASTVCVAPAVNVAGCPNPVACVHNVNMLDARFLGHFVAGDPHCGTATPPKACNTPAFACGPTASQKEPKQSE